VTLKDITEIEQIAKKEKETGSNGR